MQIYTFLYTSSTSSTGNPEMFHGQEALKIKMPGKGTHSFLGNTGELW